MKLNKQINGSNLKKRSLKAITRTSFVLVIIVLLGLSIGDSDSQGWYFFALFFGFPFWLAVMFIIFFVSSRNNLKKAANQATGSSGKVISPNYKTKKS
jgi:Na+/proline symporter